ncbi:MAG: hypothetical protein A2378_01815 [Candidatus Pacebacteria bacterium RIFOXYB1_FULL_44_10]|nr:MAG: hypothetical protein A2378_01815 [Candidatus Pacebacteria bacterium RIFOXYB1_FULL_44_10]
MFIGLLAETGLIGAGAGLYFLVQMLKTFSKKHFSFWLQVIFLVYLVHAQFSIVHILEKVIFWISVGMIMRKEDIGQNTT